GGALKRALYAERHANFLLGLVDGFGRFTKRSVGRQVERDGDHGELSLVIDGQGAALHFKPSEGAEGNGGAIHRRYRAGVGGAGTGGGVRGSGRTRRSRGGGVAGAGCRGNRLRAGRAGRERRRSQGRTNVDVLQL